MAKKSVAAVAAPMEAIEQGKVEVTEEEALVEEAPAEEAPAEEAPAEEALVEEAPAEEAPAEEAPAEEAPAEEAPAEEAAPSLYDGLLQAIHNVDPNFPAQGPTETTNAYLERMVKALNELPDDGWNSLSAEAQGWVNDAIDAWNANTSISLPEGYTPPALPTAPRARSAMSELRRAKEEKAGKSPKEKPAKAPPQPRGTGLTEMLREIVVEHGDDLEKLTKAALKEIAQKRRPGEDIKDSTVSVILTDTKMTLGIVKKLGRWASK